MSRALAVGLTLVFAGCGAGGEADLSVLEPELEQEVRGFLSDLREALADPDPTHVRTFYVSDDRFRWLEDGETRYSSVDDILAALAALPGGGGIETEYGEPRITILSSTLASVEGGFASAFGDPDAGGFSFSGMTSMILEREDDSWRVLSGHTSTLPANGWEG